MIPEALPIGVAAVIVLGISAQWLAWRFRLPSILLLLVFGFLAGPVTGFLDPSLLQGDWLFLFVSFSVAIILFEGGLSLRFDELRDVASAIRNLITVGVAVTAVLAAVGAHYLAGFSHPERISDRTDRSETLGDSRRLHTRVEQRAGAGDDEPRDRVHSERDGAGCARAAHAVLRGPWFVSTLRDLATELFDVGLALPNFGDVATQRVGGAVGTGTHVTGLHFPILSAMLVGGDFLRQRQRLDPDGVFLTPYLIDLLGAHPRGPAA